MYVDTWKFTSLFPKRKLDENYLRINKTCFKSTSFTGRKPEILWRFHSNQRMVTGCQWLTVITTQKTNTGNGTGCARKIVLARIVI